MITTNLRITEPDWRQIKAMAGEMGMSVNKYINYLIRGVTSGFTLGLINKEKKETIWDLPKLAKMKNKPSKFSGDDEIIYE